MTHALPPFDAEISARAQRVLDAAGARGWTLAVAESCTAGMLGAALTAPAGASAVVDRGFITYSNDAKIDLLGVDPAVLEAHGAVSEPVARQMAIGALRAARVPLAVAITGVAGPGASAAKPEGRVHLALARALPGAAVALMHVREDFGARGRSAVRLAATARALELMDELLSA